VKSFFLLFTLFLGTVPSRARIGETWDQCIDRYDSPISDAHIGVIQGSKEIVARFAKSGYFIDVVFLDGISGSEIFRKIDRSEFTDLEKNTLLDANSGNEKWTRSTEPSVDEIWIRDDGATAGYRLFEHSFAIFSKKYDEKVDAQVSADQKNKLKDF
jgi:hypothetical protein